MYADAPPPYAGTPVLATPKLAVSIVADPATQDVLISIVPPREPLSESDSTPCTRAPVDICCVVDVSGSMGDELKALLEEGKDAERTGLSTLDVVKHAVRTIVATTHANDRMSIVSFSNTAQVVAGLTAMTVAGKAEVLRALENLRPLASTNIWDGLKTGMNVLNDLASLPTAAASTNPVTTARVSTLFLLTDGMPNINPPRGIVNMLKSYIDSHPLKFSIHTFGFGYTLDSQLLLQIARVGNGAFGFIPDASSLGAVFIHAVANLYSTCADNVELSIEYPAESVSIPESQGAVLCSWGAKIEVGSVQYGQTRDFVVNITKDLRLSVPSGAPVLSAVVRYRPWTHGFGEEPEIYTASLTDEGVDNGDSENALINLKYHVQRSAFVNAVDRLFKPFLTPAPGTGVLRPPTVPIHQSWELFDFFHPTVDRAFRSILSALQSPPLANHKSGCALAEDISGECLLALSSSAVYRRWGQHYLPSLARYHLLQQCGSYRNPGLQVYGAESPLFISSRDTLDQIFDNLPPAKPSVSSPLSHRYVQGHGGMPTQSQGMSAKFASRSGPCFDGTCEVTLMGGRKIPVRDLRRGFHVETPRGARKVVAVLETPMDGGTALLCELPGGLKVTPWHPIKYFSNVNISGRWVFPARCASPELRPCEAVYSLLLEMDADPDAHSVYVQDTLCVTLGHGITYTPGHISGTDIRAHPFLGDYESIVRFLASFPEADVGEGLFRIGDILKDGETGMISGFVPYNISSDSEMTCGVCELLNVEISA